MSVFNEDGLFLLGGTESPETTVLLPSGEEFSSAWHVEDACVISLNGGFIITGGVVGEWNSVVLWGDSVSMLPSLKTGRRAHACGYFEVGDGNWVFLVTGGYGFENRDGLSSTEMLGPDSWQKGSWMEGKPTSCLHEFYEY